MFCFGQESREEATNCWEKMIDRLFRGGSTELLQIRWAEECCRGFNPFVLKPLAWMSDNVRTDPHSSSTQFT